jgi:hypothetical protein
MIVLKFINTVNCLEREMFLFQTGYNFKQSLDFETENQPMTHSVYSDQNATSADQISQHVCAG